jgi:hypothetical protein
MAAGAHRFVATDDICAAVRGHETEILDALGIFWRTGRPHITCPYPEHADNRPSWRWSASDALAFCSCTKSDSIFDIIMTVRRAEPHAPDENSLASVFVVRARVDS